MWGHDEDENGALAQTRKSDRLPGFVLPDTVRVAIRDQDAFVDTDVIVCAIQFPPS